MELHGMLFFSHDCTRTHTYNRVLEGRQLHLRLGLKNGVSVLEST